MMGSQIWIGKLLSFFISISMVKSARSQELRQSNGNQSTGSPTVKIGALIWNHNLCVKVTPPGHKLIVIPYQIAISPAGCAGQDHKMLDYSDVRKAYGLPAHVFVPIGKFDAVVEAVRGKPPTRTDMNNIAGKFNEDMAINKGTQAGITGTWIHGFYDRTVTSEHLRTELMNAVQGTRFKIDVAINPTQMVVDPPGKLSRAERDKEIVNSLRPVGPPGFLLRPKDPNSAFCKKFPGRRGC